MFDKLNGKRPYQAVVSTKGWSVICRSHLVAEDLKLTEAHALADALNRKHRETVK